MYKYKALVDRVIDGDVVLHSSKHGKYRWLGEIFLPDDTLSVNQKND